MPNRILRDWTDSEVIEKLSAKAEVFFTRLIMKADDFGCYYANTKLLKSNLYPLRDSMRPSDITPLLRECEEAGLIGTYTVAGKEYLVILKFQQRLRINKSRYADPPTDVFKFDIELNSYVYKNDRHLRSNDGNPPPESESESETETETETEFAMRQAANKNSFSPEINSAYLAFNGWIKENCPNVLKIPKQISIDEYAKLREKYNTKEVFTQVVVAKLLALHNNKKYYQGKQSVYLTILNWIGRDGNS